MNDIPMTPEVLLKELAEALVLAHDNGMTASVDVRSNSINVCCFKTDEDSDEIIRYFRESVPYPCTKKQGDTFIKVLKIKING